MRHQSIVAAVCLGALAIVFVAATLAAGQPRYMSRAEAVRVDVLVTDGRKPVRGLTAASFEVRDNGVPQSVEQIETERLPST